MYATVKTLSVLALAGSALAAPSNLDRRGGWGNWAGNWGGNWGGNRPTPAAPAASAPWTNWASTATVYVTAAAPPTGAPAAPSPAAPVTTPPAEGGQFFNKPSGGIPSGSWGQPSAPPAQASPAPGSGAPSSNDGSWQSVVAEWRGKMGLKALTPDSQLTANAQKTADESVGGLKHQLNSGSFAQVLAPGEENNFEHVFVGGWLCEVPSTPGLDGVCTEQSKGWAYNGQTGHNEILISPNYSKIGCAHSSGTGVWSCDLA